MDFCISSMDPHLYGHGFAQIYVHLTEISIAFFVAMSKFESSSHGSALYSSSHDCLYFTWISIVLVISHDEIHMNMNQSFYVLQNKLGC